MAATTEKISALPTASTAADLAYFVGIKDNGDSTFTTQKFSLSQLRTELAATTKKLITVAAGPDSSTLTDTFFASEISEISTNNQCYLLGVDYTQDTGTRTITGIRITFSGGQKLLARI